MPARRAGSSRPPVFDASQPVIRAVVASLAACSLLLPAAASLGGTFTNPIISDGADPWIVPGAQYSATVLDGQGASKRFYRVKSSR